MKNVFRLLMIAALAVTFALPAFAQEAAAAQADDPAKTALYEKFVKERGVKDAASQKAAYETGKEYLSKYGAPEDQYNTYVRNWVAKYEVALREFEFNVALEKDPSKAFQMARGMLANDAGNLALHLRLVQVGLANSKIESIGPDTLNYAKRGLQLIEQGKTVDQWTPFKSRDEAIGWMNYAVGAGLVKNSPEEAAPYLIKAAQTNGPSKMEPTTYQLLGTAYLNGEFKRLAAQYKPYEGQPETPEGLALFEQVRQALDRTIDAYARAVALHKDPAQKKAITDVMAPLYKGRHENSTDASVQEYIAGVLNRPLPTPGQPVTPATPTSTGATATPPAANSTAPATGGNTATTTNGAKPSTPTPKP